MGERVDRVSDIEHAVVIDVGGVLAGERLDASDELEGQVDDRVGDVDLTVPIDVPAYEGDFDVRDDYRYRLETNSGDIEPFGRLEALSQIWENVGLRFAEINRSGPFPPDFAPLNDRISLGGGLEDFEDRETDAMDLACVPEAVLTTDLPRLARRAKRCPYTYDKVVSGQLVSRPVVEIRDPGEKIVSAV